MQNGYCHEEGGLGRAGVDVRPQKNVIPRVKELVRLARLRGISVLWSRQQHYPEDATRKAHRIPSHLDKRGIFPCLRETWDEEFVDELKTEVRAEDHVFIKHRSSCFFDTNLDTKLRMLGIRSLIISGVSTNYCVESTIRDAYARDYDLYVVEDCVAGSFPDLHEATLKNVRLYFGRVVTVAELEGLLS